MRKAKKNCVYLNQKIVSGVNHYTFTAYPQNADKRLSQSADCHLCSRGCCSVNWYVCAVRILLESLLLSSRAKEFEGVALPVVTVIVVTVLGSDYRCVEWTRA